MRELPAGVIVAGGLTGIVVLAALYVARERARKEAIARGEEPPEGLFDGLRYLWDNDNADADTDGDGVPESQETGEHDEGSGSGGGGGGGGGGGDGGEEWYCEPGSTFDPRTGMCVRIEPTTPDEGGSTTPTCPPGYAWDGQTCRLIRENPDGSGGGNGGGGGAGEGDPQGDDDGGSILPLLVGTAAGGAYTGWRLSRRKPPPDPTPPRPPSADPPTADLPARGRPPPDEPRGPRGPRAPEEPSGPRPPGTPDGKPPSGRPRQPEEPERTRRPPDETRPRPERGRPSPEPTRAPPERPSAGGASSSARAQTVLVDRPPVRPAGTGPARPPAGPEIPTMSSTAQATRPGQLVDADGVRLRPIQPSEHVGGPRPAGEPGAGLGVVDDAARAAASSSKVSRLGKIAAGAKQAAATGGKVLSATKGLAWVASDAFMVGHGAVIMAQAAPTLLEGGYLALRHHATGEGPTPEQAARLKEKSAQIARVGSQFSTLGFGELDLDDAEKTGRSPFKLGIGDYLGQTDSKTGNLFRANVAYDPNARLLGLLPIKAEVEENNFAPREQFVDGARNLLKSDSLKHRAAGVAVAPGAIVAEASTIERSQFVDGARNLLKSDNLGHKAAGFAVAPAAVVVQATTIEPSKFVDGAHVLGGKISDAARDTAGAAGHKLNQAGTAVAAAPAATYEKTGLGGAGNWLTQRGLNPFASPAPAPAPTPPPAESSTQEKNDRDYAIFLAKRGEQLPENLKRFAAEVAQYRPPGEMHGPQLPPPAPLTELQRRIIAGTEPPLTPAPSAPAPLTELQRRILSGTEPKASTPAAPQPVLGPNNSAAAPSGGAPVAKSHFSTGWPAAAWSMPAPAPSAAPPPPVAPPPPPPAPPPAPAAPPPPPSKPDVGPTQAQLERIRKRLAALE